MGCDIHLYVEKYINHKKRWISADIWRESEWSRAGRLHVDYHDEVYSGRNYALFSMLANVRNGYGFAGCDTGDGFIPISEPKGLPTDVSPLVRREHKDWGLDAHSASYLTLKELKEYNWYRGSVLRGVVDATNYQIHKMKGKPPMYWYDKAGPNVRHLTNEAMEIEIKAGTIDGAITTVEWTETYADCVEEFLKDTMPKLEAIKGKLQDSEVRIVFWFDN